jgi:hypothetical protein
MTHERLEKLSHQLRACFVPDESLMRRLAAAQQRLREISEGPDPREEERLDRIIRSAQGSIPSAPRRKRRPGPKRTLTAAQIDLVCRYHAAQRHHTWEWIAKKLHMSPTILLAARRGEPISDTAYRKLAQLDYGFKELFEHATLAPPE